MKIKPLHLFFIIAGLAIRPLQAQISQHFTLTNGLQGNGVYRLHQDRQGFIWLATPDGISRFDGYSFTHFNAQNGLPSNDIWYLLPDRKDRMWYFTKANQLGYIKNDKIFSFSNRENIPFYPQRLYQSDTLIAFYSRNSLEPKHFYFSQDIWKALPLQKSNGLYVDIARKYFYTHQGQNMIVTDSLGKVLLSIPKLPEVNQQEIRQINDSLFVALYDKRILYLNTKTLEYKIHVLSHSLKTGRATLLDNQIQVSGEGELYLFDLQLNLLNTFLSPKGIDAIFHLLDRSGNLWIATLNNGLFFIPKMNNRLRTHFQDIRIKNLLVFNDQLFVHADQSGYFSLSPQNNLPKKVLGFGAIGQMQLTHQGKGLVITNENQLYTQLPNEKEAKITTKPQKDLTVLGYYNNKWYNVGLSNLQISEDFRKLERILPFDASQHLKATRNQLFSGGVDGLKKWNDTVFTPFKTKDSLHIQVVTQLKLLDINQLLVGTESKGLYLINHNESKKIIDLDGKNVKHLFVENQNCFWVVTNSCLIRLQSNDFWTKGVEAEDAFCHPFLLLQNGLNAIAVLDKTLFLATNKGLVSLPYDDLFNIPQPEFYVKSISFNHQDFTDNAKYWHHTSNNLSIQLATLQFLPHQAQAFEYRLLPQQEQWIGLEGNNITLSGFEPGSYTLELRQIGLTGQTLKYKFDIMPQWWQHWLFNAGVLFCIVALISALVWFLARRKYIRRQQRLEQLKTQTEHELHALRSQMNPHFVFNSLNAIQYYLNKKGVELSEKYLVKFSQLIRMIFDFSARKTISLQEETELISSYLELEKMRFQDKLSYHIHIDKNLDIKRQEIPSMLLQPLVENAVNHGIFHSLKAGIIVVKFLKKDAQTLEAIVEDNGVGIPKSKLIYQNSLNKHPSKSSEILKSRINLINQTGRFTIKHQLEDLQSEGKSGTRVTLTIHQPLNKNSS